MMKKPTRHKYEYKVSPGTAAAKIARMVGEGKRVLELGPGPGAITRLLKENACRIIALELDPKAIDIVSQHCEKVLPCDLNDSEWPAILADTDRFEVIVAGEVLEHLYDPWRTLSQLHRLLEPEGSVVISLPHIAHCAIISCLLSEDFEYQPWGLLDRTHIRFFGLHNIQKLLNDAGFKIIEADFVIKAPEQTEFARNWRRLPAEVRQALEFNRHGNIYQVVVRATSYSAPGGSLQLTDLPVPPPGQKSYSIGARGNRLLGFVLSFLGLRTREKIARLIERIGFRL